MLQNNGLKFILLTLTLFFLNFMGPLAAVLAVPFFFFREEKEITFTFLSLLSVNILLLLTIQETEVLFFSLIHFNSLAVPFILFQNDITIKKIIPLSAVLLIVLVVTGAFYITLSEPVLPNAFQYLIKNSIELPENVKPALDFIENHFFSMLFISESILLLLNMLLYAKFKKKDFNFRYFRLNDHVLILFLAAALAFIFTSVYQIISSPLAASLTGNFLIIITFFYFLQGLAVISFWMKHYKTPVFMTYFVYLMVFMQPGPFIAVAIGFAEVWLSFRERKTTVKKEKSNS